MQSNHQDSALAVPHASFLPQTNLIFLYLRRAVRALFSLEVTPRCTILKEIFFPRQAPIGLCLYTIPSPG